MLHYMNVLRGSHVINITLKQVLSAKPDNGLKEAFVFKNEKYKAIWIHGSEIILASENFDNHIEFYICYLSPLLIDDKH